TNGFQDRLVMTTSIPLHIMLLIEQSAFGTLYAATALMALWTNPNRIFTPALLRSFRELS
ncbi:MAG: hypothetical protein NC240_10335, partial [Clostridium sp.]|nr:hypothetical protein [Clostridium sp.]